MKTYSGVIPDPVFVFCLLFGRIPLWVLFIGWYVHNDRINSGAFACFTLCSFIGRSVISYYDKRGEFGIDFSSLIYYSLKPFFIFFSYISLIIAAMYGNSTDFTIILLIFFMFIFYFGCRFFLF